MEAEIRKMEAGSGKMDVGNWKMEEWNPNGPPYDNKLSFDLKFAMLLLHAIETSNKLKVFS